MADSKTLKRSDEFLTCLRKSGIVDEPALEAFLRAQYPQGKYPEPKTLATELVQTKLVTSYQAKFLLRGKYKGFLIGGRYRILRLLGQGGMGAVYQAQHLMMNRLVAIKAISREWLMQPEAISRFRREVQAAAQLHHPNIVTAYDAEQSENLHYLVMEYVEGTDLAQLVEERGPLPVQEVCEYIRQAALGLQHAHEHGMIHRDIKPHNLMLTKAGPKAIPTVKILDFGLARFARETDRGQLTAHGVVLGTPDFMAPEQARRFHETDIRSDIYSLGCTLYYLLTGRVPFPEGDAFSKFVQHAMEDPSSFGQNRTDVPLEVTRIFRQMTAKNPADRYQTPAEVARALAPFAAATSPGEAAAPTLATSNAGVPATADLTPTASLAADSGYPPTVNLSRGKNWLPLVAFLSVAVGAILLAIFMLPYLMGVETGEIEIRPPEQEVATEDAQVVLAKGGQVHATLSLQNKPRVEVPVGEYEVSLTNSQGLGLPVKTVRIRAGQCTFVLLRRVARSLELREVRQFTGHREAVACLAITRDGRLAASAGGGTWPNAVFHKGNDHVIRLWEIATGKEVQRFQGHEYVVTHLAFAPDGQHLLSTSADDTMRLWNLETGKEVRRYRLPWVADTWRTSADFSPDGRLIASSGGVAGTIQVFDTEGTATRGVLLGHQRVVSSVRFLPDGQRLLSGAEDNTLRLWHADQKRCLRVYRGHEKGVRQVVLLDQGRRALSASDDQTIRLWDVENGMELRCYRGHRGAVQGLALLPDGKRFLSTSRDGTVRLWEIATGRELGFFAGHQGHLAACVACTPDGQWALSGGSDTIVRIWPLSP
jgi:WD40 repeat protein